MANYGIISDFNYGIHIDVLQQKKFKTQSSTRKVIVTLFKNSQPLILEYYLENYTIVNGEWYCLVLSNSFKTV